MREPTRSALVVVFAVLGVLGAAVAAHAHAQLLRSSPRDGHVVREAPRAVVLTFSEGIDAGYVRLQVRDAARRRVDRGATYHPSGREDLAVRLQPDLDGRYAVSYRVISQDGHPVTRRLAFTVRRLVPGEQADEPPAPATEPGRAMPPAEGGDGPMAGSYEAAHEESGPVTSAAFAAARGLGYLAMALAVGGIVFLLVVWRPALRGSAGGEAEWERLSERFARRARAVVLGAAVLGVIATALAIGLEAATLAGTSFWAALDPEAIQPAAETRVVEAWSARQVLWLVLAALVLWLLRPARMPVLRRAELGAAGTALRSSPSTAQALILFAVMGGLAMTAPLAGHAASHGPGGLLAGTDTIHVLCMCSWLGGLVMLVLVLPLGVRARNPSEAVPLLAMVVARFSRVAMIAVTLLLLSGIVNSVVLVASVEALVETPYGRLMLAKIALFSALVALGAFNQRRLLPALRALPARGDAPGRTIAVLRRSVALEIGFAVAVIGITSVLVATQPAAAG